MGDTTILQNGSIFIKNQSTGALSFKWYLNNQFISSAGDFTNNFPGVGAYNVRLVATNGTCNDEKLITVIVLQQCFQPAYQQILHSPHQEFIKQVYNLPDESTIVIGSIILAGRSDKDGLMMKLDRWGKLQWAKCYGGNSDDEFTRVEHLSDAGNIVAIGKTKSFGDPAGSAWAAGIDLFGELGWSQAYYDNTPDGIVFNDLVKFGNGIGVVGTYHKNTVDPDALFLHIYGLDGRVFEHKKFANPGADEGLAISILNDTFCMASGSKAGSSNDIILTKINNRYLQPFQSKRIHIANAHLNPASIFYYPTGLLINATVTNTTDNNPIPTWINTTRDLNVTSITSVDHGVNAQNFAAHTSQNDKRWNASNEGNKLNLSSMSNNVAAGKTFSFAQPITLESIALNTDSTLSTASNIAINGNTDILLTKTTLQATNYGCAAIDLTVTTSSKNAEVADDGWQSISDFTYNTAAASGLVTTDLIYTVETLCEAPECKSTGPITCSPESFFKTYADDYNRAGFGKLIVRANDILTLGGVAPGQGAGVTSLNFNGEINHISKYGNTGNNLSILNFMQDSDGGLVYIGYKSGGYNIMLLKTAPAGNISWANSYKFPNGGLTSKVIEAPDGNYIFAYMIDHFPAHNTLVLVKVNRNDGNIIWQKEHQTGRYSFSIEDIKSAGKKVILLSNSAGGSYPHDQYYLMVFDEGNGSSIAARELSGNTINYRGLNITLSGKNYLIGGTYINDSANSGYFFSVFDENFNLEKTKFINIENQSAQFSVIKTADNGYMVNSTSFNLSTGINLPLLFKLDPSLNIAWIRKNNPNIHEYLFPQYFSQLPDSSFIALGSKNYSSLNNEFINGVFARYTSDGALLGCPSVPVSFYYPPFPQSVTNFSLNAIASTTVPISPLTIPFSSGPPLKVTTVKCNVPSACSFLKISGIDSICSNSEPETFEIRRNVNCISPVTWNTDTAYLRVTGYSDSSISVMFLKSGTTKISASVDAGCEGILKDSIVLNILSSSEKFTLGGDLAMCNGNTIVLHAPKDSKTFKWQNGSTDSIFTITKPGTYTISVTDYCDNQFSDTINVRMDTTSGLTLPPTISHCKTDTLLLRADSGFDTYTWIPNYFIEGISSQTVKIFAPADTAYVLMAGKNTGCSFSDTIRINTINPQRFDLGSDTAICQNQPIILSVPSSFSGIVWSTGSTASNITVSEKGAYSVKASDLNGCNSVDTLLITSVLDVNFDLGIDTSICSNQPLTLSAPPGFSSYHWSNGSISNTIVVSEKGTYTVTATTNATNCAGGDSISIINVYNPPTDFLDATAEMCKNSIYTINPKGNFKTYLWSTQDKHSSISVRTGGLYGLQVTDQHNCANTDSIFIQENDCITQIYFPTAFTPNNDGKNDIYKASFSQSPEYFKFKIFNRLGQLIFEISSSSDGWDGKFKGMPQPTGAYVWKAAYKFSGEAAKEADGLLTLIR